MLVAILTVALTACEPVLNGQVSISVNEENELLIGICHDPMKITEVRVRVYSEDDRQVDSLVGFGSTRTEVEQVLVVREGSDVIDFGDFDALRLEPKNTIEVSLYEAAGEEGDAAWGEFTIPDGGLRPGRWLFADGSGSDRVCGAYVERIPDYAEEDEETILANLAHWGSEFSLTAVAFFDAEGVRP